MIKQLIKIDDHTYEELKDYGFSEHDIERYKKSMLTDDKLNYLIEIKQYYPLFSDRQFEVFEQLNVEQLADVLKWGQECANDYILKEQIDEKLFQYRVDGERSRKNMRKIDSYLKDYLRPDVFERISEIAVSFIDERWKDGIAIEVFKPKTLRDLKESFDQLLMEQTKLFLSDKPNLLIEVTYLNKAYSVFFIDTRKDTVITRDSYEQILQASQGIQNVLAGVQTNDIRMIFENYMDLKSAWQDMVVNEKTIGWRDTDRFVVSTSDDLIKGIKDILCCLSGNDAADLYASILTREELDTLVASKINEGASSLAYFLKNFNPMSLSNYVMLDGYANVQMIDLDAIDTILTEMEELEEFTEIRTYERSRSYIKTIEGEEEKKLIEKCQENYWLKDNGALFQDGLDESDYPYSFIRVERRLDLINYLESAGWAIRNGFVYDDMAFIQQVNGGDEYWTLIKHEGNWYDFESVTFRTSIERGEFYRFLDEIRDEGIAQLKEKERKRMVSIGEKESRGR